MADDHPAVRTELDSLPTHARQFALDCLDAIDPLWDPSVGLVGVPGEDHHRVRASSRYAIGLLLRDGDGDRDRAAETLETVLDYQFTADPENVYYGTWARDPPEFGPIDDPTEWEDYDPNWREFVGTTLAVIHDEFGDRLPGTLRERMAEAVRTAAAGTLDKEVPGSYTNIALMRAFLLQWTADRFENGPTKTPAEYASEIYRLFRTHETFCEFNSPTYAGVDLNALGQWVSSPRAGPLRERGREMETALWCQLGEFYHADLGILCGPYARAYGMDTRHTDADYYIRLAAPEGGRELSPDSHHTSIPGNYCAAFLMVALAGWSRAPEEAIDRFESFEEERLIARSVDCGEHGVEATAWLGETAMVGGFSGADAFAGAGSQFHPGTLHWRIDDESVGWGRVRRTPSGWPTVRAEPGTLRIEGAKGGSLAFELGGRGIGLDSLEANEWRLPGLEVGVEAPQAETTVDGRDGDRVTVRYEFDAETVARATLDVRENR